MPIPVIFSPEALEQLADLESYIAEQSYPVRAIRYVERLAKFCERLGLAPLRGQSRDDFRPGARSVGFERRVTVLFEATHLQVTILGIYYAGRQPPYLAPR